MTKDEYEKKIAELYERLGDLEQAARSIASQARAAINMMDYMPKVSELKRKRE